MNKNNEYRQYGNNLLSIVLNHNAATVELAARMIAAGEMKQSTYKKFTDEFKRLHKTYSDEFNKTLAEFEKALGNENGR